MKCAVVVSPSCFYLVSYVTTWRELAPALFLSLRRPPGASRAKNNSCFTSCSGAGPLRHPTLPARLPGWAGFICSAGDWMQGQQPFSWDFGPCHFDLPPVRSVPVLLFCFSELDMIWFDSFYFCCLRPLTFGTSSVLFPYHCPCPCYYRYFLTSSYISDKTLNSSPRYKNCRGSNCKKRQNELIQWLLLQLAFFVLELTKSFTAS